jgi:hypothetical protein
MNLKLISAAALVVCSFFANAQTKGVDITLGKPYPVVDAETKLYFREGNEILSIKNQDRKFTIQKFDAVKLTALKIRVYEDFPKKFQIEGIRRVKDAYYVFYSLYENENEQLFAREIDFASGQFKGTATKIVTVTEKLSGGKFNFQLSYDGSMLLVHYRLKPDVRDDSKSFETIGTYVFDQNLKEQWHDQFKMPYTEKKMNTLDYSVDSDGSVYMVISVYKDDTTDKRGDDDKANYTLQILKYTGPSKAPIKTKVEVADKFIHTIWLYENGPKDYMICAGFYNSGTSSKNVDGIIAFKLGKEDKAYDMVTYPIPLEILNQNATRKEKRKNGKDGDDSKGEFKDLVFDGVKIQEDGSLLLMSEQFYTKTHYTSNGNGGGSSYTTYHYEDMLVTKISADGSLAWMKKLPKTQMGTRGMGGMSYRYFNGAGTHHFLFLDNEKNKDLSPDEPPAVHADGRGGFLTRYTIDDKTGDITKVYMVDLRDVKGIEVYQFWPGRTVLFGDDTFIFEAYIKGKEDILIKMQMKK